MENNDRKKLNKKRRKALGQHFLRDRKALNKILRLIDPQPQDTIIEIGAGKGMMTFPLALKAGRVFAIEKDRRLIPILKAKPHDNLTIVEADALRVSFRQLLAEGEEVKLVGNLPYSISTPILFKAAEDKSLVSVCLFLLQKEVAERVCASPGRKAYAPMSIYFQNYFAARQHFILPPSAFSPPPKVDSAFISLTRREEPLFPLEDEEDFLGFLKSAFRHRRKKLINNLITEKIPATHLRELFTACGIDDFFRPEQVHLEQYVNLYRYFIPLRAAE
jgi:16S rRNA (adenine1518-N6/adenine1519-N6)-dimethyltransferase